MEFDADAKTIIGLFIFILIGIVFFSPIITYVNQVSSPGSYTTVGTTSSFVANPYYAGSAGATIASLVPIFYLLVIIAVPAFVVYRMTRER
ncbi:VP3-like protein [Betafusellovirus yellowstonense]|uniref:VP3-like protein n=1 Tax=Betafusellovirus yellowstonense TaxID=693629 RepID=D1GFC2_9VIRU|nr:virion structural protein [Acidianus spindle-shaped virus 1]ACZ35823.1 VP3-like protein [Acidianus spindle-shaped virus 1]